MHPLRWTILALLVLSMQESLAQDSTLVARADTLVKHGEWKAARKICDKVIAAGNAPAHAYFLRGVCANKLQLGWDPTMEDLGEALRRDPDHYRALAFRGKLYFNSLMFDRSVDDLTEAITHAPDTAALVDCYTERGSSYSAQRKFDAAIADFRRALELDTAAYSAYGRLANAFYDQGRREEALPMQIHYTERVPHDYTGFMNVGFYLGEMDRYQEALPWYDKAWALADEDNEQALVLNNRGYARYKLGDLSGALKDIRKSIQLRSWNSYAHRNLALVLLARGEDDEACTALENALKWGFTSQYGDEVQRLYRSHCK